MIRRLERADVSSVVSEKSTRVDWLALSAKVARAHRDCLDLVKQRKQVARTLGRRRCRLASIETLRTCLTVEWLGMGWIVPQNVDPIGVLSELARELVGRQGPLGAIGCAFDQRVSAGFAFVLG
jgi:hypothetical protein